MLVMALLIGIQMLPCRSPFKAEVSWRLLVRRIDSFLSAVITHNIFMAPALSFSTAVTGDAASSAPVAQDSDRGMEGVLIKAYEGAAQNSDSFGTREALIQQIHALNEDIKVLKDTASFYRQSYLVRSGLHLWK